MTGREENMHAFSERLGKTPEPSASPPLPPVVKPSATRSVKDGKSPNHGKASQAVDVLAGLNGGLSVLLMGMTMFGTASALEERDSAFREMAYKALIVDPKLCDRIIRMGGSSGMLGLIAAYGMLGMAVYPVAKDEAVRVRGFVSAKWRTDEDE